MVVAAAGSSGSHGCTVVKPALAECVPLHRRALADRGRAPMPGLVLLPRVLHAARAGSARRPCRSRRRNTSSACRAASAAASPRRAPAPRRPASRCAACRGCRAPSSASRRPGSAASYSSISRAIARAFQGAWISWKLNGRCTPPRFCAVVGDQPLDRQVDLADQHPLVVTRRATRAHLGDDLVHLGLVGRVERQHAADVGVARRVVRGSAGCRGTPSSLIRCQITSTRKPSTPRSSQKRSTSYIASRTSGLRQLRSGCSLQEGVVVVLAGRLVAAPRRCRRNC